ncbi:MAG TPA: HD domain-containing phosphohydrolase [Candidatus Omnitrophota bacterium]|nr:HD domain-containing phosphohydrolase [Candidatus Omnitrophota bacterium]HRY85209.1 HD domain-containing phosphohydrolase [Candidatus Omnitrophota bacterium]
MPTETDRLNANKLDYQEVLRDVARMMVRLKRPDRLLKIITRFIDRQFGLTHTSLLVLDPRKKRYVFVNSKGSKRLPVSLVKFDVDHPMVQWFSGFKQKQPFQKEFLFLSDVKKMLSRAEYRLASNSKADQLAGIQKAMQTLKAELIVPGYFKDTLVGVLMLGRRVNGRCFTKQEVTFFQTLAHDCSMAVKTAEYNQSLVEQNQELARRLEEIERMRSKEQKTYYEIMRSLAEEVHAKEPNIFGHVSEVERLGLMTAREMGIDLSGKTKDLLSAALILHDVGKIGIPDSVLSKPGRLTPEEWKIMKTHVEKGARILEPLTDFKKVREIILSHHERFDGSGYPRGLKGDQISIEARIISVVDSFHAIVSSRCYREGRSLDFAIHEIRNCAGTQFDPVVVDAFLRALKKELQKKGEIPRSLLEYAAG